MPSKLLLWIAVVAMFAGFWLLWVRSSFGVPKGEWVDVAGVSTMLFYIIVQVLALRANRQQRVK